MAIFWTEASRRDCQPDLSGSSLDSAEGVGIGGVGEDEAGFIELARIVAVGREEKVERCAVLDLREKVPARAEGEVEFYTGLFFVGGGDVGEGGFEVGGGGDV